MVLQNKGVIRIKFNGSNFSTKLASCTCESKQSDPFFFPIKQQRVMLITACPSLQTVSGSLLSVRFVRQMLYALFGEKGVSDEGLMLLFDDEGLYWTHFNKCYNERFYRRNKDGQYLLQTLPTECAKEYLEYELAILSESLKVVVIMGDQTCRSAATYTDAFHRNAGRQIEVVKVDYLQNENPENYVQLREKVATALGRDIPSDSVDPSMLDTTKTRMRVGLDIEFAALKAMSIRERGSNLPLNDSDLVSSHLDRIWLENVILTQKGRQAVFLSAWSAIESALIAFFVDALDPISRKAAAIKSREWLSSTISKKSRKLPTDCQLDFRDLVSIVSFSNGLSLMDEFIDHMTTEYIPEEYRLSTQKRDDWKILSKSLDLFRHARNILIHRGGYFATAELERKAAPIYSNRYNKDYKLNQQLSNSDLRGIRVLTNTLFLSVDALGQVESLTDRLFRYIICLDEHLNK